MMAVVFISYGCSKSESSQFSHEDNGVSYSSASTYDNGKPELDFDTYNILTTESVGSAGTYNDIIGYEQELLITNNGAQVVSDISITVCYYDAGGNILYNDSRGPGVSLKPGQSISVSSYCPDQYESCEVTNYMYSTTDRIQGEYDGVDVDVVAKTITGYYTS